MTLADSSAVIEFLRDTGSVTCNRFREPLIVDPYEIAICDAVQMEILAGARDDTQVVVLGSWLSHLSFLQIQPMDYESAAALSAAG